MSFLTHLILKNCSECLKAVELNDITYMVSPRKYDFIIIREWKHIVRGRVFHNVGKEGPRSSNIKDL